MIRFGEDVCCSLDAAFRREWIEANGIGGFASGTMNGCNTRRYHGLLVAATKPPVGRFVLLSKFEETLIFNGHAYELGTNRYPGVIHPQGFQYLKQFRLNPFPTFTFCVNGIEIEIFEGDAPHRPVGCIAQACSVAEVLRAAVEDIRGIQPGENSLCVKSGGNKPHG
jgi:glycogen debranching enzyme